MTDIWGKWETHYRDKGIDPKCICKDGIINEDEYRKSFRRILFIMKEVNKFERGDLREMLAYGPKY